MRRTLMYQPGSGYRFNSDSIFLYAFVRSFSPKGVMLDVGCGSGILSLLLSRDSNASCVAIEKQPHLSFYAQKNYSINGIDARVVTGDFLTHRFEGRFDFIVSNPPFYGEGAQQSADVSLDIARRAVHLPLNPFVKKCASLLKPRGSLYFCYDAKEIVSVLCALEDAGLRAEVVRFVHPKATKDAKIMLVRARKNSKAQTKVAAPLIVFDEQSRYNDEARYAFDTAMTHIVTADKEPMTI